MFQDHPSYIAAGLKVTPANGGIAKSIQLFADALKGKVLSFSDNSLSENDRQAFPNVFHLPANDNWFDQWYGRPSQLTIGRIEPCLIGLKLISCHGLFGHHVHWTGNVSKKINIPYWVVPHGSLYPYVFQKRYLIKLAWWRTFGAPFLENAASVIFSSEEEREQSKWLYQGNNTHVINWPVSGPHVELGESQKWSVRHELHIPDDCKVALYLGRLHTMKCPLQTIEALASEENSKWHLIMIGPSGDISAEACCRHADDLGVTSRVHILGPKYNEDKFRYIRGADFFISLSYRENFGHSAAECLSAAIPCILSPGNALVREVAHDYPKAVIPLVDNTVESARKGLKIAASATAEERVLMSKHANSFVKDKLDYRIFKTTLQSLKDVA